MTEGMFRRVQLERKTAPNRFLAASGEQIRDMGEKTIPFKTNEVDSQMHSIPDCDSKYSKWNNDEVGREQLSVHSGPVDFCLDEICPVFSWQGQWPQRFRQACETIAIVVGLLDWSSLFCLVTWWWWVRPLSVCTSL